MLHIVPITDHNRALHHNLAQIYEAEFAPITGAIPDADGRFWHHTTEAAADSFGWILYDEETPLGFTVLCYNEAHTLVVQEFFVLPHARGRRVAFTFLALLAEKFKGWWDIRQLPAAESARRFWRKWCATIDPCYIEDVIQDEKWGTVSRQLVNVR